MKNVSAGVRVAILFFLLVAGAYLVFSNLSQNPAGKSTQTFYALFKDASGLPKKSKVVVAGLPQGEVTELEVNGRYAKVTFRMSRDIKVWSSATVLKKATSLLGENYLEVDPGEEVRRGADGTKDTFTPLGADCKAYESPDKKLQDACRHIDHVVESTTPDQLLHRIDETLPNVDRVLASVHDLSEDLRGVVNGPLKSVAARVDGLVQKEANNVAEIIERANRITKNVEGIANDLRSISKEADPKIKEMLKNLDDASADAKDLIATAKSELTQTGDKLRGKLDKLDGVIDNTTSITKKIDEDKGTLEIGRAHV